MARYLRQLCPEFYVLWKSTLMLLSHVGLLSVLILQLQDISRSNPHIAGSLLGWNERGQLLPLPMLCLVSHDWRKVLWCSSFWKYCTQHTLSSVCFSIPSQNSKSLTLSLHFTTPKWASRIFSSISACRLSGTIYFIFLNNSPSERKDFLPWRSSTFYYLLGTLFICLGRPDLTTTITICSSLSATIASLTALSFSSELGRHSDNWCTSKSLFSSCSVPSSR